MDEPTASATAPSEPLTRWLQRPASPMPLKDALALQDALRETLMARLPDELRLPKASLNAKRQVYLEFTLSPDVIVFESLVGQGGLRLYFENGSAVAQAHDDAGPVGEPQKLPFVGTREGLQTLLEQGADVMVECFVEKERDYIQLQAARDAARVPEPDQSVPEFAKTPVHQGPNGAFEQKLVRLVDGRPVEALQLTAGSENQLNTKVQGVMYRVLDTPGKGLAEAFKEMQTQDLAPVDRGRG